MTLSLVPDRASGAGPDEVDEPPADQPPHDPIGKIGRQSFYAPMGSMDAAKSALARFAALHRYNMWEVVGALMDLAADNPNAVDDYLLKYRKAREQKAGMEVS